MSGTKRLFAARRRCSALVKFQRRSYNVGIMVKKPGAAMLQVAERGLGRAVALAEDGAFLLLRLVKRDGVVPEERTVQADPTSTDSREESDELG